MRVTLCNTCSQLVYCTYVVTIDEYVVSITADESYRVITKNILRMPEGRVVRRALMALAEGGTIYPKGSLFMDCQEMEMDQLVALAQRRVECTGQTITLRRTTTVPLDLLSLRWNSNIHDTCINRPVGG